MQEVTAGQIHNLLHVIGCLGPLVTEHDSVTVEDESKDSASTTIMNVCNRLDTILAEDDRWSCDYIRRRLDAELEYIKSASSLNATREQAALMESRPHSRLKPTLSLRGGLWVARLGPLEGTGETPEKAIIAFDLNYFVQTQPQPKRSRKSK